MPQPQGMNPNPMGNMDMGNVGNFPGGMMMPAQMGGFPGNGMYIDPNNINMQMMFAANAAAQGSQDTQPQQFPPGMMGGNQFMPM